MEYWYFIWLFDAAAKDLLHIQVSIKEGVF